MISSTSPGGPSKEKYTRTSWRSSRQEAHNTKKRWALVGALGGWVFQSAREWSWRGLGGAKQFVDRAGFKVCVQSQQ